MKMKKILWCAVLALCLALVPILMADRAEAVEAPS
jgi:hypothetical protein